jgi:hypothetical protein
VDGRAARDWLGETSPPATTFLPANMKTTIAPRILAPTEMEPKNLGGDGRGWTDEEWSPRMCSSLGGLTASGGDFGFETEEIEPTKSDR